MVEQPKSIKEACKILYDNSIRYYSITQTLLESPVEFKVTLNYLDSSVLMKIQSIKDLGYKNIKFELIELY